MLNQKQQEEENIDWLKTPNYDKVCIDIKKLIAAGAQTFIPEACTALRNDWFHGVSDRGMKENLRAQQLIRKKVNDDWSKEENIDGIWKSITIEISYPDWLRNPNFQETAAERNRLMQQVKKAKKNQLSDDQKHALDRFVTKLPETVIIREEPIQEPIQTDIEMELAPEMQGLGEQGKDVMTIYGEINGAAQKLFKALTQRDELPGPDEDIIVDYVKPTREARKAFVEELKHAQFLSVNSLQRNLAYLDHVLGDMLEILEEAKK